MKRRKTLSGLRAALARAERQYRAELRYQRRKRAEAKRLPKLSRFLSKFRPSKEEKGHVVFLTPRFTRVKRIISTQERFYAVYVSKSGKKSWVKKHDEKAPKARTRNEIFGLGTKTQYAALKKQKELVKSKSFVIPVKQKTAKQVGTYMTRRILQHYLQPAVASRKPLVVEATVKVRVGRKKISQTTRFTLRPDQVRMLREGKQRWLPNYIWQQISTELALENMVTAGSRSSIGKMKQNRGKPAKQWRTRHGDLWGKAGYKVVKFEHMTLEFWKEA